MNASVPLTPKVEKFNPLPPGKYKLAQPWTIKNWNVQRYQNIFPIDTVNGTVTFPPGLILTIKYYVSGAQVGLSFFVKDNKGTALKEAFNHYIRLRNNKHDIEMPVVEVP